jgi:hypothetical protein
MIGTTAAILGAAVIGAGAGILGSSKQASATKQATQAATDAKTQDIAAAKDMYNSNVALLDPFREQGLRAGRTLSDLLLGPSSAPAPAAGYAPPAGYAAPPTSGSFVDGGGQASSGMYDPAASGAIRALSVRRPDDGMGYSDTYISPGMSGVQTIGDGRFGNGYTSPVAQSFGGSATGGAPAGTVTAQPNGQSAWDTFRNSTNYQFRLGEGQRSLNQGYAANGTLQSGAAAKALLRYGQDYASNELGNYMNLLGGQQNMGLNAARAVAGVGGDLTGQTINANDSAASAVANAALANGKNQAALYGSIGGTLGKAIGALGGSSYGSYGVIPPGFGSNG